MKAAFIITSAIRIENSSMKDQLTRLQQTIHTIDSIQHKVKDVTIFLVEVGHLPLTKDMLKAIPACVKVISLHQMSFIEKIKKDAKDISQRIHNLYRIQGKTQHEIKNFIELNYIKSFTESMAIDSIFKIHDFTKYDLVFKISGRYYLNERFNIGLHKEGINARLLSNKNSIITVMWSFSGSHFNAIKKAWPTVYDLMYLKFNSREVTDIEHAMFNVYFNSKDLDIHKNYIGLLGVCGIVNNPMNPHIGIY